MNAQHTPGPWMAIESQPGIYWIDIRETIGGAIATVWNDYDGANSHLIASSPDLLELAERAPNPSAYHGANGFELERFLSDYDAWMVSRRDTIAKAKGEA